MERNARSRGESSSSASVSAEGSSSFNWQRHEAVLNDIYLKNSSLFARESKELKGFWPFFYSYQSFKQRQRQSHGKHSAGSNSDRHHGDGSSSRSRFDVRTRERHHPGGSKTHHSSSGSAQHTGSQHGHQQDFLPLHDRRHEASSTTSVFSSFPTTYNAADRINLKWLPSNSGDRRQRYFQPQFSSTGHMIGSDVPADRIEEFKDGVLHYLQFLQKQKFDKVQKIKQDRGNLPIAHFKEDIAHMVSQHQVVVVAGDTGCGKSTQVPQFLLEAGFEHIACTQPRRIACISLAKRVAYETLNEYGSRVAYKIRFESTATQASKIIFLTEGLLLRQISGDAALSMYNVIIVDEVHERHIHGDFLLGVLRCLLQSRPDLKLVLMSATINIDLFSGYFDNCPVIKVPGRLYPIQLEYVPIEHSSNPRESRKSRDQIDARNYLRVMQTIDHKYPTEERGDLLVFVSGMKEIQALVEEMKVYAQETKRWIILALHSALSIEEQDKVFDIAPDGVRKCIVSTNIAETSVTIDGVRFILDSGKVKEMGYDSTAKMRRLQEFWISRASAEQRKGRAGRTGPGVCYRLYSQADYESLQPYSTPEIQRVPLDSLVLQMASLGLEALRSFPFLETPSKQSMETAIRYLKDHGALDSEERLTTIGAMLAQLPVDVMIGKLLIMGTVFQVIQPILTMAACLSVQSPFHRMADGNLDVQRNRRSMESEHGDPFTLFTAFNEWVQVKSSSRSGAASNKWCRRRGLEQQRFYEIAKLRRQFETILSEHGLIQISKGSDDDEEENSSGEERGRRRWKDQRDSKPVDASARPSLSKEQKTLRYLKRQHRQDSRKRKVLRLDENDATDAGANSDDGGGDAGGDGVQADLHDLEFKLSHNMGHLQRIVGSDGSLSLLETNLIKIILCSGLYPHLAVADEFNNWKRSSDHVFHSKTKQFVLLHPTSVFSTQPDLLIPQFDERAGPAAPAQADATPRVDPSKLAKNHSLLAFVDLLETNKPYLVNNVRVPALQTLLLFSHTLDTNQECTRIIADEWLEVCMADAAAAEQLVSAAQQLRTSWATLLSAQLQDNDSGFSIFVPHQHERRQRLLAQKLAEFLGCTVFYSLRKLPTSELKAVYSGTSESSGVCDSVSGLAPHPSKGGVRVNEYLTFNCLRETSTDGYGGALLRFWQCPTCSTALLVTPGDRMAHEQLCGGDVTLADIEEGEGDSSSAATAADTTAASSALAVSYHCPLCDQQLMLTPTQILLHKQGHRSDTTSHAADAKAEQADSATS